MSLIETIIIGVIQGVTEFFPISSAGHLILTGTVFSVVDNTVVAFDALLYIAIATAVIVYFFSDLWILMQAGLRKLGKLPVNKRDETLLYSLLIAAIPAVILGLFLESLITSLFQSPLLIAGVLLIGSVLLMYAEWIYQSKPHTNEINIHKGFKIGLFQALALMPGMSRSGATIAGGMLLGLSRLESARFSFLLVIPVTIAASMKKIIEMISSAEIVAWIPILMGSVVAFFVALLAIHLMLKFIRTHTLWPFIWYRIILASFMIFITVFG